ncbi:MAG: 30S ribosomal protein S16 [Bacteroidetes bacterium]|nr:MAG: 30S ribosomal protein S16 [Bacteroidota bacterium]
MAVRIRLFRRGRKKMAMYDIVVADARAPRDGRFIEKLGNYNPNTDPATIELNADRAFDWVMNGAQPSDTARTILSNRGVMLKKHLQIGVNKGAITQEAADKKLAAWMTEKDGKVTAIVDGLAKDKAADVKARFEAETKVKEARAEALLKKQSEMIAAEEAAAKKAEAEAAGDEGDEATEGEAVEASAETATEEAPAKEAAPEATTEEAPVEEAKTKEAAPEAATEEAPAEEAKAEETTPEATTKEATPEEAPAEEAAPEAATEEAPAAEKKEEKKD